jgi:hypothetical protein
MIYSISEYSEKFLFKGKRISLMTLKRRCEKGQLPSGHHARKLPGRTGDWVIEILDEIIKPVEKPVKTEPRTISRKFFNFR